MATQIVAQDGDAYALTETMSVILVTHHEFPHPEAPAEWADPGDLSEWIIPPETEHNLRTLGYDHRDVHHRLYLVPFEDLGPLDVMEHHRLSRDMVEYAVAVDFLCTRDDVAAVRAAAAQRRGAAGS
ncbi:hypothetical protein [Nonomuraea sp. NPDC005650]|uniref:hypothetical protein n=1 Tax=Nonomuraea sp. NPDC005650 TaxID=3157045 RepID=UPI0033B4FFB5